MSEILNTLSQCSQISEWVTAWDDRLVQATGEPAPNKGCNIRDSWDIPLEEHEPVDVELRRLIIPRVAANNIVSDCMSLEYPDGADILWTTWHMPFEDWTNSFPLETTEVIGRTGTRLWVAVGLLDTPEDLGLAIFSAERPKNQAEIRVQQLTEGLALRLAAL